MKIERIFLIAILLSLVFLARAGAENSPISDGQAGCFPEYKCGEWNACIEGLKTRDCADVKCGRRSLVERTFCDWGPNGCAPEMACYDWSQCYYGDKVDDFMAGKISFGGYRTMMCYDKNNCVESFIEEGACEETFNLNLNKVEECGREFLVASDKLSNRAVAKIDLNSWKSRRLDILFTQGETKYCPTCYDGIKDDEETGVDCGGKCKECKKEAGVPYFALGLFSWGIFAVMSLLIARELVVGKKGKRKKIKEHSTEFLRLFGHYS